MLLREIQSIILTFDDGKEALKKYQEILEDYTVIKHKMYKDYSEIFEKWVYKISYEKDTLRLNKNY